MNSVVNHTALPYFDRMPPRILPIVQQACERIESSRETVSEQHLKLAKDLNRRGFEAPSLEEFKGWHQEVKLGRIKPADYSASQYDPAFKGAVERALMDCLVHDPVSGSIEQPSIAVVIDPKTRHIDIMEQPITGPDDVDPAALAFPIIESASKLRSAMIAAGYSAESCDIEDTIVADAIEDWLMAKADGFDGVTFRTPVVTLALMLLHDLDDAGNEKLLGVLATYMQAELMAAIVAHVAEKGGAA